MKHFFTLVLLVSLSYALTAQNITDCSNNRYLDEIFSNVTVISDIQYGSNIGVDNQTVNLLLDVYQPTGDTETNRPLILLAHGGSFISGSKTLDNAIVTLCQRFAKMGYVTASMNYRLENPLNVLLSSDREKTFLEIVYRAVQDQKAAIRFFRKSVAENGNPYGINPNIIIIGGSSAGGVLSIHTAYLDEPSEIPSKIDTAALGSMEGNSGNPGYSSIPQAVINLCGAIGDTSWIKQGNQPIVSVHGSEDGTVPANADIATPMGLPITLVYGSIPLHQRVENLGIDNDVKIFWGQDHVPYQSNSTYMDTTVNVVKTFLHDLICNKALSTENTNAYSFHVNVYPNPVTDVLQITLPESIEGGELSLLDLTGKLITVRNIPANSQQISLDIYSLQVSTGYYLLRITTPIGQRTLKVSILK
ncbi:MAG: T9SS type A sorting domain-containing protein [Flavobacteriales bacterium]|nr:T9SS type A sorting domain-containing protein [Flavobacteriales bacterium]